MRRFLARFSEAVWSGHVPSWADFITTTPELKFFGTHKDHRDPPTRHLGEQFLGIAVK
jgi:hypothetical protein